MSMTNYSQENLRLACRAIARGMSGIQASKVYKVPRSTLYRRMKKGQFGDKLKKGGRFKVPETDEQRLVDWFVHCKQMGFITARSNQLCVEARNIVNSKNPSKQEKFGRDWLRSISERHRKLRDAMKITPKKKYFDKPSLELWFKGVETFCTEHKMMEVLEKPTQLYYCCKLQLTDNINAMLSYSAQGMATPPMLVYENFKEDYLTKKDFDNCILPKGWVKYETNDAKNKSSTCMYYIHNVLYPYLQQKNILKPIFIFMDFQNNLISLDLYELCDKLKMFIINSYPNSFKLTQKIQTELSDKIQILKLNKNINSYLEILKNILISHLTKENMSLNFSNSGIYPFDIAKINLNLVPVLYPVEDTENLEDFELENVSSEVPKTVKKTIKSDVQLSFVEFQSMLSEDMKNRLELNLFATGQEELNTTEFDILLKMYRKFCANSDQDVVAVRNEPLLEDPLNGGYVVGEMDETEDIKPFDQWLN